MELEESKWLWATQLRKSIEGFLNDFWLLQRQADFHPEIWITGFQIKHKINWKVYASSRGIQSKIHLKLVHSFGRIWIRISDLWHSFGANPFSDQWSIKSTLVKDSLDHWSEWSANGSSDQWSGAFLWAKDPKWITAHSSFDLELNYVLHIMRSTSMFGRQHLCYGKWSLNLFRPIIEWKSSEIASEIQIFKWVMLNFVSVLPQNCRITPPNTHACNLQDGTACFVTLLEALLLVILNLLVCFSDLFAAILPYL